MAHTGGDFFIKSSRPSVSQGDSNAPHQTVNRATKAMDQEHILYWTQSDNLLAYWLQVRRGLNHVSTQAKYLKKQLAATFKNDIFQNSIVNVMWITQFDCCSPCPIPAPEPLSHGQP